jgi:hypothetical protein
VINSHDIGFIRGMVCGMAMLMFFMAPSPPVPESLADWPAAMLDSWRYEIFWWSILFWTAVVCPLHLLAKETRTA